MQKDSEARELYEGMVAELSDLFGPEDERVLVILT